MSKVIAGFESARPETIELLRRFNVEKRCTFLTSSNYMHAETAKLGFLLSSILNDEYASNAPYRTFFVNSSLEALSGVIKLARQTSVRQSKHDEGWILLIDEGETFRSFLNPTGCDDKDAATSNVRFANSINEAVIQVNRRQWSAVIHVRSPHDICLEAGAAVPAKTEDSEAALSALVMAARKNGALIASVDSEIRLNNTNVFKHTYVSDVFVYGENLTDRQVPFGCFTMTQQAHSVWNNNVDCFAQTSTFGGNRVCSASALEALERHGHLSDAHRTVFREIDTSFDTMIQVWGRHVNPGMAALGPVFGMDVDVRQAWDGRFRTGDGREILDCSAGFGSNLRGHNPSDIPELLRTHDVGQDYFAELEALLARLTKFQHAFPAVSGATAVDVAATLGLLANPTRKKVVTFEGNFSGKTLFAVNLSKHGPQLTESDQDAFRPYYRELVYIDPFATDAVAQLTGVLRGGDVALVWFEMIRGGMCEQLPDALLEVIDGLKVECGYLIGVDEVLTGGWRGGQHYLAHHDKIRHSDIVSIGKTLSDMTLPMAAVIVTDTVYKSARNNNPAHVERLRLHYLNQLSAHIALNALSQVSDKVNLSAILLRRQTIEQGLREIVASSKLLGQVRGHGSLLLLTMNARYFPFHHRSKLGNMLEMAISHLIFIRCGVFIFLLRFLHRVSTTDSDVQEILRRLRVGLSAVTPFMVYRYALSRVLSSKMPRLASLLAVGTANVDAACLSPIENWQTTVNKSCPPSNEGGSI